MSRSVTFRPAMMERTRGPALGMAKRYRSRLAVCRVSKPTFSSSDSCASVTFLTSFASLRNVQDLSHKGSQTQEGDCQLRSHGIKCQDRGAFQVRCRAPKGIL